MRIIKNGTVIFIVGLIGLLAVIGYEVYQYYIYESPADSLTPHEIAAMEIEPLNINTADAEELDILPHITDEQIKNILEYREAHGSFTSVKELLNVKGVGKVTYNRICIYLTV